MPGSRKEKLALLEEIRVQEKAAVRSAALKSSFDMAQYVLFPDLPQAGLYEPLHRPLCDFVDSAKPGARKLVLVPRMHRKTYLLTYAHIVRRIAVDPNVRILVVTALDGTAKKMMNVIRKIFTDNKGLSYYFPELVCEPGIGNQYELIHPLRTIVEQNPSIRFCYTGAPLIGNRADIVICDDAVAEDKVATQEGADKNNTHLNELVPILDVNPTYDMMFVIGTRKASNDYYAIASGQATSAETKDATPVFEVIERGCLELDGERNMDGEPILPTVFTKEKLLQMKEQCAANPAQGEGYWYREMMNFVQAPTDQKFMEPWFDTWVEPAQVPANTVFSGFTIDSAFKDEQISKARGDTTACLIGHYDTYGNLYLTDGYRGRPNSGEFRKLLIAMVQNPKNRQPQNLIKEKVGEGTIFSEMRRWFTEARLPLVVHPLPVVGRGEKVLRIINALQSPLMGRKVFFVKGQFPDDLHRILVDELTHLGQWGHDDVADALALFFHPDVRPLSPNYATTTWKVPMSRAMQISTPQTNRAASQALMAAQVGARPATGPQPILTAKQAELQQSGRLHRFTVGDWGQQPRPPAFKYDPIGYLKGGSE